MAKFGLATEGITDQIVIENILCGFYDEYEDLDDEIQAFQPAYDETTQKQKEGEFGGWEMLLEYLSEKRFRDDVLNSEYTIIQIDTDICEHVNFDVKKDTSCIETLILEIKERLIRSITNGDYFFKNNITWNVEYSLNLKDLQLQYDILCYDFYYKNKDKIIFAISVHSLECWILPLYKNLNTEKITGCFESLQRESKKIKVKKDYKTYDKLTKDFLKKKNLMKVISKSESFGIFINSLPENID